MRKETFGRVVALLAAAASPALWPATAVGDEVDDVAKAGLDSPSSSCDDTKLAALRKDYDSSKKPEVLRDIGACYEARGEIGSAIAQYDAYLRAAKKPADEATVRGRMEALKAKMAAEADKAGKGFLEVKVNVNGAEISVDGEKKGTSPLKKLPLTAGLYEVGVTSGGYPDWLGTATVKEGETTTLDVELEKPGGFPTIAVVLGVVGALVIGGVVAGIVVASNRLRAGTLGTECVGMVSSGLCN